MYTSIDIVGVSRPSHRFFYLYSLWASIKDRCTNVNSNIYKNYGGRGIVMCTEWSNDPSQFILWVLNNLGPRPVNRTFDRIHNDGDYIPNNCRWATYEEQTNNQRAHPTNTGLPGISYVKEANVFDIRYKSKRIGRRATLTEAITFRDSYLQRILHNPHQ